MKSIMETSSSSMLSRAGSTALNASKTAGVQILKGAALGAGVAVTALIIKHFAPKTWNELRSNAQVEPKSEAT